MNKGVCASIIILFLITPIITNAKTISIDPCGETKTTSNGNNWLMQNNCILLEMRKNNYDPNTNIYDKINKRYFSMMANRIEERNNEGTRTTITTITSMNLRSDIDDGYIRWKNNNTEFGYIIKGNSIKIVANITDWNYQYNNSTLWLDIKYHKNDRDIIKWIPTIVDKKEETIITENRLAGQNEFVAQKIGRGKTIIIDPYYYVDYSPTPAQRYANGQLSDNTYLSYDLPTDVTTTLSDTDANTVASIRNTTTDHVLKLLWNHTYQNGYQYFVRFYKASTLTYDYTIYQHINTTHINLSKKISLLDITGRGFFNINITGLMNESTLNYTAIRFTTDDGLNDIAEVMLREEINDTQPPTISNCTVTKNNFTCGESITFKCLITDNIDVAYSSFTIAGDTFLAIKNDSYYYYTITNNNTQIKNYAFTMANSCDLFNQCNDINPSISSLYICSGECEEEWDEQYTNITSCQNNNTIIQQKTYIDQNNCGTNNTLPIDNGTISENYCDYCEPLWVLQTGGIHECQTNNTKYVEYTDYNFCYEETNLSEDEPPYDHQTWIECDYNTKQFNCTISSNPYLREKIEYSCILPNDNFKCINQIVYGEIEKDILQVNPQKKERTNSIINIKTNLESRESFSTQNKILNAYYTNKNLVANTPFEIETICNDGNVTLIHEQDILPSLKPLHEVPTYYLWVKENSVAIIASIMMIIIIFFIVLYFIKSLK